MKKLLLLLSVFGCTLAQGQVLRIADTGTLRGYVNTEIVTNGTKAITAVKLNNILNGFLNAWPNYTGYVPTNRTITINGVTHSLNGNMTFTIPVGLSYPYQAGRVVNAFGNWVPLHTDSIFEGINKFMTITEKAELQLAFGWGNHATQGYVKNAAGAMGQLQFRRNGAFAASDTLTFLDSTLRVKNGRFQITAPPVHGSSGPLLRLGFVETHYIGIGVVKSIDPILGYDVMGMEFFTKPGFAAGGDSIRKRMTLPSNGGLILHHIAGNPANQDGGPIRFEKFKGHTGIQYLTVDGATGDVGKAELIMNTDNITQGSTNLFSTTSEKGNWNSAFGWGNHATAGYLTNITGKIAQGANISITGNGNTTPYTITGAPAGSGLNFSNGYALGGALNSDATFSGAYTFYHGTNASRILGFNSYTTGDININSSANVILNGTSSVRLTGTGISQVWDTATYKPAVFDASGNVKRGYWAGSTPGALTTTNTATVSGKTISAINNTITGLTTTNFAPGNIEPLNAIQSFTTTATVIPAGGVRQTEIYVTAQAGPLHFGAPSTTPTDGDIFFIRISPTATGLAITWDASVYRAVQETLPSTTTNGVDIYVGGKWNSVRSKIDILSVREAN